MKKICILVMVVAVFGACANRNEMNEYVNRTSPNRVSRLNTQNTVGGYEIFYRELYDIVPQLMADDGAMEMYRLNDGNSSLDEIIAYTISHADVFDGLVFSRLNELCHTYINLDISDILDDFSGHFGDYWQIVQDSAYATESIRNEFFEMSDITPCDVFVFCMSCAVVNYAIENAFGRTLLLRDLHGNVEYFNIPDSVGEEWLVNDPLVVYEGEVEELTDVDDMMTQLMGALTVTRFNSFQEKEEYIEQQTSSESSGNTAESCAHDRKVEERSAFCTLTFRVGASVAAVILSEGALIEPSTVYMMMAITAFHDAMELAEYHYADCMANVAVAEGMAD